MQKLSKEEMMNIKGGGISVWVILGIGALVTFLVGVIDGIVNPLDCNN